MTLKVFLSYRRNDSPHASGRLRDRLTVAFGEENVFYDVDSIPTGRDFREVIRAAIRTADTVVVMIGPGFDVDRLNDQRDYVRMELLEAFRQKKVIVPVLIDTALMPTPAALPSSLRRLGYINASPIRQDPDFHRDCERLIAALRRTSNAGGPVSGPALPGPPPSTVELRPESEIAEVSNELAISKIASFPFSTMMPNYKGKIGRMARLPTGDGWFIVNDGDLITRVWGRLEPKGTITWQSQEITAEPGTRLRTVGSGTAAAWSTGTTVWVRVNGEEHATEVSVPELDQRHLALLAGGRKLAVASTTEIKVLDVASGEPTARTEMPEAYTRYGLDRMWSTQDSRLVTAKYASQVVWDEDLHVVTSLDQLGITAHYVSHANAVDSTGRYFAACAMPHNVVVVDIRRNGVRANFPLMEGEGGLRMANDLVFHPDFSNILVAVQGTGAILGCNALSMRVGVLAAEEQAWTSCFFANPDLFVALDDKQCVAWKVTFR
jgi:TIR domain